VCPKTQRKVDPAGYEAASKVTVCDNQDVSCIETFFIILFVVPADLHKRDRNVCLIIIKAQFPYISDDGVDATVHLLDAFTSRATEYKISRDLNAAGDTLPILPDRPGWTLLFDFGRK
jgi:hypothetical protein